VKLIKKGKFWYYRFEAGGMEIFRSSKATDKETAKQIAEQVYTETILGHHKIRKAPSLKGIAHAWISTKGKTVSPSHLRAAKQCLASVEPLHKIAIDRLTQGTIDGWAGDYLQSHSRASLNQVLRYLKLWLRWAIGEGYMRELPCKLRQEKPPQRERPVVPLDKIDEFLEACTRENLQIPAALCCAMMLGMREKEILGLQWAHLQEDVAVIHGKGGKIRRVSIPRRVLTALGWMVFGEGPGPVPRPAIGLVFPGEDGKPHVQGWLRQALARGAEALKVPVIGIHRMRATFATLHLRKGTSLKDTQAMMGHADPRTTLIYQETSLEEQAKHQSELWGAG